MSENVRYPKIISRPDNSTHLILGESQCNVEFTSGWEPVAGSRGFSCRTWKIEGDDGTFFDGGDLSALPDSNGRPAYSPIQRVNDVQVVVDAPESGHLVGIVLTAAGEIKVAEFTPDRHHEQLVYGPGDIITWVAYETSTITKAESPAYGPEMFTNLDLSDPVFSSSPGADYLKIVETFRGTEVSF